MSLLESLEQRASGNNATPEGGVLTQVTARTLKVTVSELREAIENNPDHPVAVVYRKAIANQDDNKVLTVQKEHVMGLLKNLSVKSVTKINEQGVPVRTTELGREIVRPTPPVPPAPPAPVHEEAEEH